MKHTPPTAAPDAPGEAMGGETATTEHVDLSLLFDWATWAKASADSVRNSGNMPYVSASNLKRLASDMHTVESMVRRQTKSLAAALAAMTAERDAATRERVRVLETTMFAHLGEECPDEEMREMLKWSEAFGAPALTAPTPTPTQDGGAE